MKPFLASSKSRLSSNGRVAETPLRNSMVYIDGCLPLASKCCSSGLVAFAACACAAPAAKARAPPNATAAPAAIINPRKGRMVFISFSRVEAFVLCRLRRLEGERSCVACAESYRLRASPKSSSLMNKAACAALFFCGAVQAMIARACRRECLWAVCCWRRGKSSAGIGAFPRINVMHSGLLPVAVLETDQDPTQWRSPQSSQSRGNLEFDRASGRHRRRCGSRGLGRRPRLRRFWARRSVADVEGFSSKRKEAPSSNLNCAGSDPFLTAPSAHDRILAEGADRPSNLEFPPWVICGRPSLASTFFALNDWSAAVICPASIDAEHIPAGPDEVRRPGSLSRARALCS